MFHLIAAIVFTLLALLHLGVLIFSGHENQTEENLFSGLVFVVFGSLAIWGYSTL